MDDDGHDACHDGDVDDAIGAVPPRAPRALANPSSIAPRRPRTEDRDLLSRGRTAVHTRALGDGEGFGTTPSDAPRSTASHRRPPPATMAQTRIAPEPMPKITRTKDKTRPRRFKDALDDDRKRKGSMATGFSRYASTDDPNEESDRERVAREARERGRAKRIAAVETEAADRLSAMVQLMRAELGNPQMLLSIDGKIRDLRFARLYERLKNYGSVEIMFGLVKYYTEHWDETEADRTVLYYGDEETKAELASNARDANAEREQNYREEQSSSSSSSDISGDVVASVDEDGDVEVDQARLDDDVDEATRRALLRAAQLRATQRGDEVRSAIALTIPGTKALGTIRLATVQIQTRSTA